MEPCPTRIPAPLMDGETRLSSLPTEHPLAWSWLQGALAPRSGEADTLAALAQSRQRPLAELLYQLHQAEGSLHRYLPTLSPGERARLTRLHPTAAPMSAEAFQGVWEGFDAPRRRTLETRPILARGEDPFSAIRDALRDLDPEGALLLKVPFEPQPLYGVLAGEGYGVAVMVQGGDWSLCIARRLAVPVLAEKPAAVAPPPLLDVRGLPPPEPMVKVLEAVPHLPPGGVLAVLHDRIPALLYPRLAERGLEVSTEEEAEGRVRLTIRRPVPSGLNLDEPLERKETFKG